MLGQAGLTDFIEQQKTGRNKRPAFFMNPDSFFSDRDCGDGFFVLCAFSDASGVFWSILYDYRHSPPLSIDEKNKIVSLHFVSNALPATILDSGFGKKKSDNRWLLISMAV